MQFDPRRDHEIHPSPLAHRAPAGDEIVSLTGESLPARGTLENRAVEVERRTNTVGGEAFIGRGVNGEFLIVPEDDGKAARVSPPFDSILVTSDDRERLVIIGVDHQRRRFGIEPASGDVLGMIRGGGWDENPGRYSLRREGDVIVRRDRHFRRDAVVSADGFTRSDHFLEISWREVGPHTLLLAKERDNGFGTSHRILRSSGSFSCSRSAYAYFNSAGVEIDLHDLGLDGTVAISLRGSVHNLEASAGAVAAAFTYGLAFSVAGEQGITHIAISCAAGMAANFWQSVKALLPMFGYAATTEMTLVDVESGERIAPYYRGLVVDREGVVRGRGRMPSEGFWKLVFLYHLPLISFFRDLRMVTIGPGPVPVWSPPPLAETRPGKLDVTHVLSAIREKLGAQLTVVPIPEDSVGLFAGNRMLAGPFDTIEAMTVSTRRGDRWFLFGYDRDGGKFLLAPELTDEGLRFRCGERPAWDITYDHEFEGLRAASADGLWLVDAYTGAAAHEGTFAQILKNPALPFFMRWHEDADGLIFGKIPTKDGPDYIHLSCRSSLFNPLNVL